MDWVFKWDAKPWCATAVDPEDVIIRDQWGECGSACPVQGKLISLREDNNT